RLSFSEQADGWQAQFRSPAELQAFWQEQPLLWQTSLADSSELPRLGDEAQRSLDLQQASLIRAVLVQLADGSQRLLLVIHHLAVDGVSWRILLEDLQRAYRQLDAGQALALPAKTSSVKAWAEQLQTYARSEALQEELGYWQAQLHGVSAALPDARPGANLQKRHAHSVYTQLDAGLTRALLQEAPAAYRTQVNDLLLTALARVIARWTGEESVLVQLEGHGREELFDSIDLIRSVGWFTSLFPARLTPQAQFDASIKQIKEQLRAIPNKGMGFAALRYLGDDASRATLKALPVPRITFNYLGQFDGSFEEADGSLFLPSGEGTGAEQDAEAPLGNWLTLNGRVYGGELSLGWTFSREQFDVATIQALADDYSRELHALVEHCLAPQHQGVTPSDFALARLTQAQLDNLPVAAEQIEDIYPLSPMQQGMLFHTLYEQSGGDYLNQMRLDVEGLDPERFRAAWQAALDEQEILRSGFVWEGDLAQPVQVVHKHLSVPFTLHDWRGRADLDAALSALAGAELARGFDLAAAPLLRLVLVQTADNRHHLIHTHHHILMDGWSQSQLMGEVLQRYNGTPLPARQGRYRDYIAWLQRQDAKVGEIFWKQQLAGLQEPTRLVQAVANLMPRGTQEKGHGEWAHALDAAQTRRLGEFARQQKITVNTLVQAAWLLLLQRYTGQDCVAFGATVAGRPTELKGVEQQVGLFINTLPVVAAPLPQQTVGQWLQVVQAQNLALREFEHTPLFDIQRWAGLGAEALFDAILVFENYPVADALQQQAPQGLSFSGIGNHEQTNYPLTLSVNLGQTLSLHYSYARMNFSAPIIERLGAHLHTLLLGMLDDPQQYLSELNWLSADESRQLLQEWSQAPLDCPSEQRVHQLFELQAARQPDAPALLFADQQLSYRQLNEQANRLARHLVALGVGPEVLVGIAAERGLDMIVGLLAVLKAGGGYVPLDPKYPQDRLLCMIEDSGVALLLSHSHLLPELAVPEGLPVLCLDQPRAWLDLGCDDLPNRAQADNLAYVMFTSGSTGRPKGVGISQLSLTRHAFVTLDFFDLKADDRALQFSTFNFDGFVEQLYPALICGASVVLRGSEIWDSETFYRELIDKRISVVDLTTAYWNMLAKDFAAHGPRDYGVLRQVHSGGEAMPVEGLSAWQQAGLAQVRLLNTYGPTEATVTVTTLDCGDYVNGIRPLPLTMPIGSVLPGRSIYLLDDNGQPAPAGVVGELVIGGDMLARGYFGRPGLTAERFLPDPFGTPGSRLYRTGDLSRYQADGVIDYVGRIDHQVKIRGFRIELGEIEARLVEHDQVHEAVVLAQKASSGHHLVGYLVPLEAGLHAASAEQQAALRDSVKAYLKATLPDYMVPTYLILLERLPLSPNGKLDRKSLPAADASQMQQAYVAPNSALEHSLAVIWQDVLRLEQVGMTDNFFELGGDSIVSIQVVSRARQAGIVFTPKDLFEQQTIGALAQVIGVNEAVQPDALQTAEAALAALKAQVGFWQQQWQPAVDALEETALEPAHLSRREQLSATQTWQLLELAPAAYRTQTPDLLVIALTRALARLCGQPTVRLALQSPSGAYVLRLAVEADVACSIRQIKESLRGVPQHGAGYAALSQLDDPRVQAFANLAWPALAFSFETQADSTQHKGLHLQTSISDGQMQLDWSLSGRYDAATLAGLVDAWHCELDGLLQHCLDPHNQGVTPSDFPLAKLSQADLDRLPVAAVDIEDIYPLSPMQEGMLFHSVSDDETELYINQSSLTIDGLDVPRLRAAWAFVTERHAIQRSSFHWQGGLAKPLQVVHRQVELDISEVDWRGTPVDAQRIAELDRSERLRGFDLCAAPLQRVLLVRLSDEQYQMIWTSHHILMDGWSSSRLFGEVLQHYGTGEVSGQSGRYRDFIEWLVNQDRDDLERFWKARLQPLEEPTLLSQAVHPRHVQDLPGHQALYSYWDEVQTTRLQQHCRRLRITLNTLVQGAWLLVLQRYTGQRTVTFGATVAGRPESLPGADSMLGLFINTLPVIQTLQPSQPLVQWLRALQAYNLEIRDYSHAPLADVQRWSGVSGQGLFDSIIVFENYPIDERLNEEVETGLSFGPSANHGVTNFPMDLAVNLSEKLCIEYMYLRNSFSPAAVEAIRGCMEQTLSAMLDAPAELPLGNLHRLSDEQQQAFQDWSSTPAAVHETLDLPQLIARHARSQPEAIAVRCANEVLDYQTLERRANQLAHALIERGAGPEVVIGVAMERSVDLLVAFLAVHKSGAAYVPLDIDYPPERLAYMIEDSAMSLLLTQHTLRERLGLSAELPVLEIDRFDSQDYPLHAPASRLLEHSLAYLIYTSGSTGRPKGVAVTHGPLTAHCQAIARLYEMDNQTRELHFMSFAFDGAHERWLSTLYAGGTLVVRDNELWTPEQTCAALHRHGITIACFPPAYLKQLAEFVQASAEPAPPVRIYCFGGDAVPEQTYEQVKAALKPVYFTNGYGPTETVVTPMLWKAPLAERCGAAYAPIGRAVGERSLYVLDDNLQPLPPGFAGELYIGGYGVARGYHRRPDISAERFVPDPFGGSGGRLYRTGDLVRLREDGVIDYVGRIDHQVKVRGFRIELGEVEASLRQQDGVSDALVIARESPSGKQLIGYVVTAGGLELGQGLKAALRTNLPEYMVPAQIVCLARFPVTPNGKLDRKALPEPQFDAAAYVAPTNERQRWLAEIWEQVLQVEQVGITDNFFELGGDSILSLQVISRVRNHPTLQMDLKLRDLMRYQSIEALFEQGAGNVRSEVEDLSQLASEGLFNLIPIQEWFFAQPMSEPHHFNQALMLRSRQPIDGLALEQALLHIVRHHDALRLRFREQNGRWYQYYETLEGICECIWHRQVTDEKALNALVNSAQRSLNLIDGPVFRVVNAQLDNGESRLMIAIHHLVIDGVSWRILLQDLQTAYEACSQGLEPQLPIRTSSFRAWAEGLKGHVDTLAERELAYWLEQLEQPSKELPCDNPRGKNQVRFEASAQLKLSEQDTTRLLKQVPAVYQTQINDVLLTALSRVLCRWSEASSVLVQFEGHGREDLFEALDLSRTLGWFTSMFPLRLQPGLGEDFGASIQAIQGQLAAVPDKGLGYGVLRYMSGAQTAERFRHLPEARVTFNYLGQFDQSFDEQALLVPADESPGACYSPQAQLGNWLEITGQVFDGQLSLRCFYSTRRYRAATVETLMNAFQAELLALIGHCLEQAVAV
ncbi:non-ribosomal peptide synthetase, partial [Pseudomonas fontis]